MSMINQNELNRIFKLIEASTRPFPALDFNLMPGVNKLADFSTKYYGIEEAMAALNKVLAIDPKITDALIGVEGVVPKILEGVDVFPNYTLSEWKALFPKLEDEVYERESYKSGPEDDEEEIEEGFIKLDSFEISAELLYKVIVAFLSLLKAKGVKFDEATIKKVVWVIIFLISNASSDLKKGANSETLEAHFSDVVIGTQINNNYYDSGTVNGEVVGYIVSRDTHIKMEHDQYSQDIKEVKRGDIVELVERFGNWWLVTYYDSKSESLVTGYISKKCIEI